MVFKGVQCSFSQLDEQVIEMFSSKVKEVCVGFKVINTVPV